MALPSAVEAQGLTAHAKGYVVWRPACEYSLEARPSADAMWAFLGL